MPGSVRGTGDNQRNNKRFMPYEREVGKSSIGKRDNYSTDTDEGRDKEPDSRTQTWISKDGDSESHVQRNMSRKRLRGTEMTNRFSEIWMWRAIKREARRQTF